MNIDWIQTGAALTVLGLVFAAIRFLYNQYNRALIKFSGEPYAMNWQFSPGVIWRFVNIEVVNKRRTIARRCVAKTRVIKQPNNIKLSQQEFPLHWADVPFSGSSTGAEFVEITSAQQRLDIAFTTPKHSKTASIAMPIALSMAGTAPQAILPRGQYVLDIIISCENGGGDKMRIKLSSPDQWQGLTVHKT